MKKMMFFFATIASLNVYSASCSVELISSYGSTIDVFHSFTDSNGRCREGLKQCAKAKRQMNMPNAECQTMDHIPRPVPTPDPTDVYNPYDPYPSYGQVRSGDLVFPLSWEHTYGGTVISKNHYLDEYKVKSNKTGKIFSFKINDLALATGCKRNICVGEKVFPESWDHVYGAVVLGVSQKNNELFIKSNKTGKAFFMKPRELALPKGCMQGVCVGEITYPRSWSHAYGARVLAINKQTQKFIVKSIKSGKVFNFSIYDL